MFMIRIVRMIVMPVTILVRSLFWVRLVLMPLILLGGLGGRLRRMTQMPRQARKALVRR